MSASGGSIGTKCLAGCRAIIEAVAILQSTKAPCETGMVEGAGAQGMSDTLQLTRYKLAVRPRALDLPR